MNAEDTSNKNKLPKKGDELLTIQNLVKELNYCDRTIRNWLSTGKMKGGRTGEKGKWLVTRDEVNRYREEMGLSIKAPPEKPQESEADKVREMQDDSIEALVKHQKERIPDAVIMEHWRDLSDMAQRIIDTIFIPRPSHFYVFDLKNDSCPSSDVDHDGVLNWSTPDTGDMQISFSDRVTDDYIEHSTFFKPLMEHLPDVEEEFLKLKALAGEYINNCYQLLDSICTEGKKEISKLTESRVNDENELREFLELKSSERSLCLTFDDTETSSALVLYREFFTTVYNDTVKKLEYPLSETSDKYVFAPEEPFPSLKYGYYDLAFGSQSDMESLIDLHKSLIAKYGSSQLGVEMFGSFRNTGKVVLNFQVILHTRILKRTFPGSCHLCPD